ncbi:MAG: hypothetical protein ACFCBW_02720 [Candidatus Competibacterales bacterium]
MLYVAPPTARARIAAAVDAESCPGGAELAVTTVDPRGRQTPRIQQKIPPTRHIWSQTFDAHGAMGLFFTITPPPGDPAPCLLRLEDLGIDTATSAAYTPSGSSAP